MTIHFMRLIFWHFDIILKRHLLKFLFSHLRLAHTNYLCIKTRIQNVMNFIADIFLFMHAKIFFTRSINNSYKYFL